MRISDRVSALKPSATLAVSARVRQLQADGVDVIGFGAGEPDFDTPMHIRQVAIDALKAGETHYTPVPGTPDARQAIAAKLQSENGIDCTADHIVISTGAKHSLYMVMQCLLDEGKGQEVIIPTPAWVSYFPMVRLAGGTVVELPSAVEDDYKITPDQLAGAITPNTTAIIINSPSNPCGTMYSPDELRALVDVLAVHEQITIVTDEIYEKIIFGGIAHFSIGSMPEVAQRVVTINGLSKAFAMTGWRIGYACAPAPGSGSNGALAKAMSKLQSQMTSNITSFNYKAIGEALHNSADDVEQMRRTFAHRAELISGLFDKMPDVRCPRPTGAFYVFPDMSAYIGRTSAGGCEITDGVSLAEALLTEAHVGVVPGADFGACAVNHIRLSFATSEESISEGCRRMTEWLHKFQGAPASAASG